MTYSTVSHRGNFAFRPVIWHGLCKLAQFEWRLAKRVCTREAEDHWNVSSIGGKELVGSVCVL